MRWGDNGQYSKKQIVQKMDNQISFSWGESNPPQLKGTATPLNLVGWFTWWKSTQREQFLYNVYLYELNKLGTVEIETKTIEDYFTNIGLEKKFIDEFKEFTQESQSSFAPEP